MIYRMRKAAGDFKVGDAVAATDANLTDKDAAKKPRRVMPSRIQAWLASGHIAAPAPLAAKEEEAPNG